MHRWRTRKKFHSFILAKTCYYNRYTIHYTYSGEDRQMNGKERMNKRFVFLHLWFCVLLSTSTIISNERIEKEDWKLILKKFWSNFSRWFPLLSSWFSLPNILMVIGPTFFFSKAEGGGRGWLVGRIYFDYADIL